MTTTIKSIIVIFKYFIFCCKEDLQIGLNYDFRLNLSNTRKIKMNLVFQTSIMASEIQVLKIKVQSDL